MSTSIGLWILRLVVASNLSHTKSLYDVKGHINTLLLWLSYCVWQFRWPLMTSGYFCWSEFLILPVFCIIVFACILNFWYLLWFVFFVQIYNTIILHIVLLYVFFTVGIVCFTAFEWWSGNILFLREN